MSRSQIDVDVDVVGFLSIDDTYGRLAKFDVEASDVVLFHDDTINVGSHLTRSLVISHVKDNSRAAIANTDGLDTSAPGAVRSSAWLSQGLNGDIVRLDHVETTRSEGVVANAIKSL